MIPDDPERALEQLAAGLQTLAGHEAEVAQLKGWLCGFALSVISRALAEGWFTDEMTTAQALNQSLATLGAWRLVQTS